jgi:hypothetical protein
MGFAMPNYQRIKLSDHPEVARLIKIADSSYKKHQATLWSGEKLALSGTYWDGGSRSTYTAINLETGRSLGAPQYNPPQFGGPKTDPIVEIPEGVAIVETGVFCGKTATASVYVNPANLTKFLPA